MTQPTPNSVKQLRWPTQGQRAGRPWVRYAPARGAAVIVPMWAIFVPNSEYKCSKTSRDGRI